MKRENEFIQGIAIACAELIRSFDEPTMAEQIVHGFGYTYADLKRAKVDGYDLRALRKEMLAAEKEAHNE